MKVCSPIIALLFILIFQWACSSESNNQVAEAKIDGAKLYKTYCVTCHGLYGDMGNIGAFDLSKTTLSLEEKIQVITHGRNTMSPFSKLLTVDQIAAVAEYTESLKK